MGYAGGTTSRPTYDDMGNHTETLQIDFDPGKISFREILEIFWTEHDPLSAVTYSQYKAVLFYHDEEQRRIAEAGKEKIETKTGGVVRTEIRPYTGFTRAEDYHQKFYLRGTGKVLSDIRGHFRNDLDFVDSTLAARINGYLGGYGTRNELESEIENFGLSPGGREALRNAVRP